MWYGLIGKNLSCSYSKIIYDKLGMHTYNLCNMSLDQFKYILAEKKFSGINITKPYEKQSVPYCDELDIYAKRTGNVNTIIVKKDNTLIGYNTDYFGLKYTIERSNISLKGKKIIILGNESTSDTAKSIAVDLGAQDILVVSINAKLNYKNIYQHSDADIIINTTPVGMYPNNGESLIDISRFKNLSGLIDVVYNPFYTKLLLEAKQQKIPIAGGLTMLVAQAKASVELFKNKKLDDSLIEQTLKQLVLERCNIIFIGIPGSGKTTISKIISGKLGKRFVDTNYRFYELHQSTIPQVIKKYGEEYFRDSESKILNYYGKLNSLSLSAGAEVVLNRDNYFYLKQNSRIYWIKRNLDLLKKEDASSHGKAIGFKSIYFDREKLYESFCDVVIENNGLIENTVEQILNDIYKNIWY